MDLSTTLKEVQLKDKEDDERVKKLLEMSATKYNLQKELEGLKMKLSVKKSLLKKLQKDIILLSIEVPVLEKQEEIAKDTVRGLVGQIICKDSEIEQIQDNFWKKINSFVSDCNWFTMKQQIRTRDNKNNKNRNSAEERENKIQLLKVESEVEVMHLYEKYQSKKLEELKLLKDLFEENSFVI